MLQVEFLHLLNKALEALHWHLRSQKPGSKVPWGRSLTVIVFASCHPGIFAEGPRGIYVLPGAATHVPQVLLDALLKSANDLHNSVWA